MIDECCYFAHRLNLAIDGGNDPTNTNTSGSINMKDVREAEQKEKKAEEKDERKEESSGSILDFTKSFFVKKVIYRNNRNPIMFCLVLIGV